MAHLPPDLKCPFEACNFEPTENIRICLANDINRRKLDRTALEKLYGTVWDTHAVQMAFHMKGFLAPFVGAVRKSDFAQGALTFQHEPRFYFDFISG